MRTGQALRLGTRGSLLAIAQSRLVMRALQAADPGLRMELITVKTHGDADRCTPLSDVDDPGFFSAELDEALLAGRVDACVHSVKDLPLQRPAGICLAAMPTREDPRDIVVFRPEIPDLLRSGKPVRIGSSSARRSSYAGEFLREALPGREGVEFSFLPLRGPVEERLRRIRLPPHAPAALDAVILALAGIARLWGDREGHAALAPLLEDTRLMVLPLSACPTAPGQGALAVECRGDDPIATHALAVLDDPATRDRVQRELTLLAARSPATRGSFSASCVQHEHCGLLTFVRGASGERPSHTLLWERPAPPGAAQAWDGADWIRAGRERPLPPPALEGATALFIAHWRALTPGLQLPASARVWVSGVESWYRLARQGVWVEGCADNLGFNFILPTLRTPVLRLPTLRRWTVLTREDAVASWAGSGVGQVVPTYGFEPPADSHVLHALRDAVRGATHFYWGSAAQYRAVRDWVPVNSHHACGPGKTYQTLREAGVRNLQAFPSRREWRAWVA